MFCLNCDDNANIECERTRDGTKENIYFCSLECCKYYEKQESTKSIQQALDQHQNLLEEEWPDMNHKLNIAFRRYLKLSVMIHRSLLDRKPKSILNQLCHHLNISMVDVMEEMQDSQTGMYLDLANNFKGSFDILPYYISIFGI